MMTGTPGRTPAYRRMPGAPANRLAADAGSARRLLPGRGIAPRTGTITRRINAAGTLYFARHLTTWSPAVRCSFSSLEQYAEPLT